MKNLISIVAIAAMFAIDMNMLMANRIEESTSKNMENDLGSVTVSNYAGAAFVFGDGNNWAGNSNAAGAPDGSVARSFIFPGNSSAFLFARSFSANIPCNAIIESVTFRITRRNAADPLNAIVNAIDNTIAIFNPQTLELGTLNAATTDVWVQDGGSFETVTYTSTMWDDNLTAEVLSDNRFGLVIQAQNVSGAGRVEADVDAVEMEVCYNLIGAASTPIDFEVETTDACFNQGTITINATGGNGTLEYSNDGGMSWQTSNTFTGLAPGSYITTVRNADMTCQSQLVFTTLSSDERVIQPGDAIVACATYPGNRVTLAIEKFQSAHDLYVAGEVGYDISGIIPGHSFEWTVEQLGGEVFSATTDQLRNIYTVTSTLYDLTPGAPLAPRVSKIDAFDASVTELVTLPGSYGAAGIEYDSLCNQLYVANLEDGVIYIIDPNNGNINGTYDPFTADNGISGLAPLGERIMAFAVNPIDGRLYFSKWNSDFSNPSLIRNTIHSVAINSTTCLPVASTIRDEIDLPWTTEYGDPLNANTFSMPVTDMQFSQDGMTLIMSEAGFDSSVPNSRPHNARALRYIGSSESWTLQTTLPPGNVTLQHELGEFSAGLNARGGISFANSGFDGMLCANDFDEFIVATSDALRGADCNSLGCIYGLQYLPITGGTPINSVLLDIGRDLETQQKGIFGDVDVVQGCLDGMFCCPDVATSDPDITICPGDPLGTLDFTTMADSMVLVYHTSLPGSDQDIYNNGTPMDTVEVVGGNATLSLANLPSTVSGIYYVYGLAFPTPVMTNCRPNDLVVIDVRVPPVLGINDPADRCEDALVDMIFSGSPVPGAGSTGVFSTNAIAGFTDNGDGTAVLDVSAASLGVYDITYTFTDAFGCTDDITTSVEVYADPTVTINDPADVCIDGFDLMFTGSPLTTGSGTGIFTSNVAAGLIDNGDGTASIDVDVAGVGTYDVTYMYTDIQGCFNSATTSVTINDLPSVSINNPDDVCLSGSNVMFTGTPFTGSGSGVFTTTALGGLVDNNDGTASLDPLLAGSGVFDIIYTYTDPNGCQNFDITTIEVFDVLPVVLFDEGNICGDPTFGANSIDLNSLINSGNLGGTWADTDGSGGLVGSVFTANSSQQGSTFNFTYTITGPGPLGTDCQTRDFVATVNVVFCNLDVALIKTTMQTTPVALNDVVSFDYTICNQGFTTVDSLEITDYLSSCYSFSPNNNWTEVGGNAVRTLTIANGELPAGGLTPVTSAPNNCITVSMDLTVICGVPDDLISYGEITGHRDTAGNDEDIDSNPGSDSSGERSVLPGDADDDSFTDAVEDDHDPGVMPLVDVALTNVITSTGPFDYGQSVNFEIEVFNQGNVDLTNIVVTDYIPCGFSYDSSNDPLWSEAGGTASTTIANLNVGQSIIVNIALAIEERDAMCAEDIAWLNEAEVSSMQDASSNDVSLSDFDSNANNVQGDDAGGAPNTPADNSVIGDGTGVIGGMDAATDEDDHDPALLDIYDLQLTKTVTSMPPYAQDSMVTYAIVIENQGNLSASNIEVEEIPQAGLMYESSDAGSNANVTETSPGQWTVLSLDPDMQETINVTFRVVVGFQGSVITNYAQITADDGDDIDSNPDTDNTVDEDGDGDGDDDDEDEETINLDQFYDLSLTKTEVSSGPYMQNSLITYEIAVTNEGTLDAADIVITDSPQVGLIFESDNSALLSNVTFLTPYIYEINSLPSGATETIVLTFSIASNYQGTTIANNAQIIVDDGPDVDSDPDTDETVDEDGDGDGDDDDEDEVVLDVEQVYDLAINKIEVSSGPYRAGDLITYQIDVTNEGTLNASNVEFEDNSDIDLNFISDNIASNSNVSEVSPERYIISSLLQGVTESIQITYQVTDGYQGTELVNQVQIVADDGDDIDSDPTLDYITDEDGDADPFDDDEAEIITPIEQIYDLSIEKTLVTTGQIFPGDDITFSIQITNEGTLNATNIEITENPDADLMYISNTSGVVAGIDEVSPTLFNVPSLGYGESLTFEITYSTDLIFFSPTIANNVEITLDDGDDIDSDPMTSNDVDEDGDGDPFDDDESEVIVSIIIGYQLGDFVWHDLDGDGIQDSNEPGVPDVRVTLYNRLGFVVDFTFTDSNGFYLFDEVFPGEYYVGVELIDEFSSTLADRGNNDLIDSDLTDRNGSGTTDLFVLDDDNLSIDLGLVRCARIGEFVWFDYNENDIRDETENGINGIRVELYRFEPLGWTLHDVQITGHKEGTPSDDGYYKFCVQPGRYYVRFVNPPESLVAAIPNRGLEDIDSDVTNRFGPGTTSDFTLLSGDDFCDLDAGYYSMGTIGDYIWMDDNDNGTRESNENGIEGVVVRAFNSEGLEVASAVSNQNGEYMIDYLTKDNYFLKVFPPLGMTVSQANVGIDDTVDSDVDGSNGQYTTNFFSVNPGDHISNVDIGLVFSVLPVTWRDVYGENNGSFNTIGWEVESEVNVDKYIVERSYPNQGFKWEEIGAVEYQIPSSNINYYTFDDFGLKGSEFYLYRIKQVDFGGTFEYSKVITVKVDKLNNEQISYNIYPNPAIDEVKLNVVSSNGISEFQYELYDAIGRLIVRNIVDLSNNTTSNMSILIDVEDLETGVYTLKTIVNSKTKTHKISILK